MCKMISRVAIHFAIKVALDSQCHLSTRHRAALGSYWAVGSLAPASVGGWMSGESRVALRLIQGWLMTLWFECVCIKWLYFHVAGFISPQLVSDLMDSSNKHLCSNVLVSCWEWNCLFLRVFVVLWAAGRKFNRASEHENVLAEYCLSLCALGFHFLADGTSLGNHNLKLGFLLYIRVCIWSAELHYVVSTSCPLFSL